MESKVQPQSPGEGGQPHASGQEPVAQSNPAQAVPYQQAVPPQQAAPGSVYGVPATSPGVPGMVAGDPHLQSTVPGAAYAPAGGYTIPPTNYPVQNWPNPGQVPQTPAAQGTVHQGAYSQGPGGMYSQPGYGTVPGSLAQSYGQATLITPDAARQNLSYAQPAQEFEEEILEDLPADTPAVEVPRLEQLPGSFQATVPTLRFNSHIHSSDPSARRVMINNLYLREGQQFAGMLVQEITDEGVVFVKDGVIFEVNASRDWINH